MVYQKKVGRLTEYFQFKDVKPVLRDLRRMKAKELSELEKSIIDGSLTNIEQIAAADEKRMLRRMAIKRGMAEAAQRGRRVGRPTGTEDRGSFLAKPKVAAIQAALDAGLSLRQAAAQAGVAVNTVRKVKALLYQKKD